MLCLPFSVWRKGVVMILQSALQIQTYTELDIQGRTMFEQKKCFENLIKIFNVLALRIVIYICRGGNYIFHRFKFSFNLF